MVCINFACYDCKIGNEMKIGKNVMRYATRFKYILVTVLGVLLITVIGENSLLQRYRYSRQIADLEDEIEKQDNQYMRDSIRLSELENDPNAIRKIARERYFMKAYDEDIFVLSDEIKKQQDEKVK